jgi:8-oxo-dGTP pyrophosphatase MutT (NUDIX family)
MAQGFRTSRHVTAAPSPAPSPAAAGRYRQSGAIPYRVRKGELTVLLVTSRSRGNWIVPKGMVEPDMTPHDSAAKEAEEEAGVLGRVASVPAGSFRHRKGGVDWTVDVYDLEVKKELDDWLEKGHRRRRWAGVEEAVTLVENDDLRDLIAGLPDRLRKPAAK